MAHEVPDDGSALSGSYLLRCHADELLACRGESLSFNEIVAYEYLEDYQKAAVLLKAYLQNYPDDQTAIREQQFLSTR